MSRNVDQDKLQAEIAENDRRKRTEMDRVAAIETSTKPNIDWKLAFKVAEYTVHELHGTKIRVTLNGTVGKDPKTHKESPVDEVVISLLRHVIMGQIVCYGIGYGSIKITENTARFDEHYLYRRLCQLPVPKIAPEIMHLDPAYYPYVKGFTGTLNADREYPRHPHDKKEIRMALNVENTEDNVINVTTNDLKCYLNDKEVEIYDKKYPILIVKLHRGERINAQLMPQLGFGDLQNCWSPVENAWVDSKIIESKDKSIIEVTPQSSGETSLTMRSYGQMTEVELLTRACKLIITKMRRYIRVLAPMIETYNELIMLDFTFSNEGSELGEILTYVLSFCPDVENQSYLKEHPHAAALKIHLHTRGKNPVKVLMASFATLRDMFTDIYKQIDKFPTKPERKEFNLERIFRK